MTPPRRCPQCDAQLADDAPEGLCPKCLLEQGIETRHRSQNGDDAETETHDGSQNGDDAETDTPRPPAPTPEELAERFHHLEILELLGHGGMGAVYKARQTRLDRIVALKIIRPASAGDAAFPERFAREARALARLSHPHIVAVHDFGEADGLYYLLMEFVDGANLRQLLRAGDLEPREALAVVPQICDALQFAHDEGVVHRDIKPENILVDKRGSVKIADFGLAKLLRKAPADVTLTQARDVMGTPQYMAPEQIETPLAVDHRADIYSLGVVFYEMLTGELPLGRFEPPSAKVAVDVRLDEVVLRALAKEPERRYQRASEVRTDVETIGRSPMPSESPAARTESQAEQLEELMLTYLPDNKITAMAIYREKTGAGLREARDAVEAIARKHGIQLAPVPSTPVPLWPYLTVVGAVVALTAAFVVLRTQFGHYISLSPIITRTISFLLLAVPAAYFAVLARRHRGTERGRTWALLAGSLLFITVGAPLCDFLLDPKPVLTWFYRVTGATPGRHDVAFFNAIFAAVMFGGLAWLIWSVLRERAKRRG